MLLSSLLPDASQTPCRLCGFRMAAGLLGALGSQPVAHYDCIRRFGEQIQRRHDAG